MSNVTFVSNFEHKDYKNEMHNRVSMDSPHLTLSVC